MTSKTKMTDQALVQTVDNSKQPTRRSKLVHIAGALSISSLLVACGGGGGSADGSAATAPNSAPVTSSPTLSQSNYEPDASKLLSEAEDSSELYVEQDFRFNSQQQTQLSVMIKNEQGEAQAFKRVAVYALDTKALAELDTEANAELSQVPSQALAQRQWQDEWMQHADLISSGTSNRQGIFERALQLSTGQLSLLVEVSAVGIENKQIVAVEGPHTPISFGAL